MKKSYTVYSVRTEQHSDAVGVVLVDSATNALSGYRGDNPPTGYVEGMDLDDFQHTNRGYLLEEQKEAEQVIEQAEDSPTEVTGRQPRSRPRGRRGELGQGPDHVGGPGRP